MAILLVQDRTSLHEATLYRTFCGMIRPSLPVSDYQKICGGRLRRIITELDLSFVQAAEIMGISKHVLNHWMKGNNPIEPHALYRLAVLKGVDFNYVFLGDWSRLPYDLAREFEAELKATLEAVPAAAGQEGGKVALEP